MRLQTSKPLSFGIITSRNTRFGFTASIVASASSPLVAGQQLDALVLELLERLLDQHAQVRFVVHDQDRPAHVAAPYW